MLFRIFCSSKVTLFGSLGGDKIGGGDGCLGEGSATSFTGEETLATTGVSGTVSKFQIEISLVTERFIYDYAYHYFVLEGTFDVQRHCELSH